MPFFFGSRILTVLSYHRVGDISQNALLTYKPNISASKSEFARQMYHIKKKYNVIGCEHLIAWLDEKLALPERAALVTFDDGYYDNLSNAYPILNALEIPAIIFLATDFIGSSVPFYWDYVAYCFGQTSRKDANLPMIGKTSWPSSDDREKVMLQWIREVKKVPDSLKQNYILRLPGLLDMKVPEDAFSKLYLNWDQVRQLSQNGLEFGSHTASHPILTRIDSISVRTELWKSKIKIEKELGKPVNAFAYPNGQKNDFSKETIKLIKDVGMKVAFSLLPGPTRYNTVKKNPFSIRRINISNKDTFPRFLAKLGGVARFVNRD